MHEMNSSVRLPRRLPPLAALRAFEAAAANLSFQRAAQELFVSPTAISHQIRALETLLETPLFHRMARRVELTPEGLRLFHMVKDGLDTMELGIAALRREQAASSLTLTTNTAFAAHWLLPRMGLLRAAARMDIRLKATEAVADLARGEADLAIRSGDGDWPALTSQRLALEHYAPMCSPVLGVSCPEDLQRHKLIHFEWQPHAKSPALWSRWFHAAKLKPPKGKESLTFSDETHAILAVIAGHGVGLLSPTLMANELASGTLVKPFGPELATGGYYLACLPARRNEPQIAAVWAWFLQQFQ